MSRGGERPPATVLLVATHAEASFIRRGWHGVRRPSQGPPPPFTVTGPGGPRAAAAARDLARGPSPPRALLLMGFSGGLDPAWRVGDLFVPSRVVNEKGDAFVVNEGVPHPAPEAAPPAGAAVLLSVGEPVADPARKAALARGHEAAAVDMETYAVAAEAACLGLPLRVLRAISDAAADPLPPQASRWVGPDGRTRLAALLHDLARRPSLCRSLVGLRASALRAGAALGEALAAEWPSPAA